MLQKGENGAYTTVSYNALDVLRGRGLDRHHIRGRIVLIPSLYRLRCVIGIGGKKEVCLRGERGAQVGRDLLTGQRLRNRAKSNKKRNPIKKCHLELMSFPKNRTERGSNRYNGL